MRWQDVLAKLTGKSASPEALDADSPPAPPDDPPRSASAAKPPEPPEPPESELPELSPTEPQPESMEPMYDDQSGHVPAETSALSASTSSSVRDGGRRPASDRRNAKSDAVARVYARALLEMAEEREAVDEIADEADQIEELLRAEPRLRQMLETPALGMDHRRELIDRVFKGRVSDSMWRFLQVVNAKDRAGAVPAILAAFQDLLAERRGVVEVNVTVAQRLDAAEAGQVAERIGKSLGKEVVLHQFEDANLIGGMVIRIGDRVIDGSVATQLRNLRRQLIERGREAARKQQGTSD